VGRFFRDGDLKFERDDIDNDERCWDKARMGVGQPIPANTVGLDDTLSYDTFVSTR